MSGHRLITGCLVLLVVAAPLRAAGQSPDTPETAAVRRAFSFFQLVESGWSIAIRPFARDQAIRALRRITKSLSDAANDKRDVAAAVAAGDTGALQNRLPRIEQRILNLRNNIHDFIALLPDEWSGEGGDLESQLTNALSEKLRVSQRLASVQITDQAARDAAAQQVLDLAGRLDKLRESVDGLIAAVSKRH